MPVDALDELGMAVLRVGRSGVAVLVAFAAFARLRHLNPPGRSSWPAAARTSRSTRRTWSGLAPAMPHVGVTTTCDARRLGVEARAGATAAGQERR